MSDYSSLIIAESGLLGYWPLDAEFGVTDKSTGGHNATAVGSPTVGGATGPGGHTATTLNGSTQCFTTAEAAYVNGTVRTFEGWANRNTSTTTDVLFGGDVAGVGPYIRLVSGGNDFAFIPDSSTGSSNVWTAAWPGNSQWVHWMFVFDEPGDTAKLYLNGVLVSSIAQTGTYNASPGNIKIGAMGATTNNPFDGSLCHVAVYNGDLSSRAAAHYAAGISADPATSGSGTAVPKYKAAVLGSVPALYWRLGETVGTTAADTSGNGNTGTYTGTYTLGQSSLLSSDSSDASVSVGSASASGYIQSSYSAPWVAGSKVSIECWAKWTAQGDADTTNGGAGIFATAGTNTHLYLTINTQASASGSAGDVWFTPDRLSASPACTWTGATTKAGTHHYVLTFDEAADTAELFVDGVSKGTKTVTTAYSTAETQTFKAGDDGLTQWQGLVDEVAVYTRILSAAEIQQHFYAGATGPISPQPSAPVPRPALALSVALVDGRVIPFGPEESDVSRIAENTTFETEMPGGHGPADVVVPRPNNFDPLDVNLFASTRIYDARNNRTFHIGRIVGTPQADASNITLTIEGWSKHLEDDNTARQIFYDRDYTAWGGPSTQRQINLGARQIAGSSSQWDYTTGIPVLNLALSGGWATASAIAEAWYFGNGIPLGLLDYAWKRNNLSGTDANITATFALSDDDVASSTDSGSLNPIGAGPGSGTVTATTTTRKWVSITVLANETAATGSMTLGEDYSLFVTFPGVVGNHNLTLQGTLAAPNTGRGLLASDCLAYIIGRWAPLLTYSTGSQGSIEPTSFVVPHLVYKDDTTARTMLDGLTVLGGNTNYPMDWGVYEGPDGKPEFFYKTPGNYGKSWRARRDQATESDDDGPDASERLNGVKVTYDDGTGTKHSVGPPGSGADTEDTRLQDTDPTNPANNDGARHWTVYDAGITSQAGAILIGQLVLANANRQQWRGAVNLKHTVFDDSGNEYPVARVRAGDSIVVEDDADTRPRRVVNTSYDGATDSVACSIGAPPNKLDVLLSRLGIVLSGRL